MPIPRWDNYPQRYRGSWAWNSPNYYFYWMPEFHLGQVKIINARELVMACMNKGMVFWNPFDCSFLDS